MMKGSGSIFPNFVASLLCCALISSCSGFGMFGKSAGHAEDTSLEDPALDPEPAGMARNVEDADRETLSEESIPSDPLISDLELKIRDLEKKIRDLEKTIAEKKPAVFHLEYIDPVQLYQKARNLLLEGDAVNAAQLFKTFADRHPNHSLSDNALYWLGECYYTLGQYPAAVQEFKNLIKTYPKAEKVPDALLKIGYSFLSLDDINRAGHYLKLVLKKYPFSMAAEKAQVKLRSID